MSTCLSISSTSRARGPQQVLAQVPPPPPPPPSPTAMTPPPLRPTPMRSQILVHIHSLRFNVASAFATCPSPLLCRRAALAVAEGNEEGPNAAVASAGPVNGVAVAIAAPVPVKAEIGTGGAFQPPPAFAAGLPPIPAVLGAGLPPAAGLAATGLVSTPATGSGRGAADALHHPASLRCVSTPDSTLERRCRRNDSVAALFCPSVRHRNDLVPAWSC